VSGDGNTNFFQHRANTRRKKKLVIKLQDDCAVWIDEYKVIAKHLGLILSNDLNQAMRTSAPCLTLAFLA